MTQASDQAAREQALLPDQSFIVQAPAGSGKTELLVKRYLTLLGTGCEQPESIIAITFTRKAAAEMKQRVVAALQAASLNQQDHPHYPLAQRVLVQDQHAQWQLLNQSQRLNILTFDALFARLMQRMPVLSQLGLNARITEDPEPLYEHAALQLIQAQRHNPSTHFAQLLKHLDLDTLRLTRLLSHLLQAREQWLPYLIYYKKFKLKLNEFRAVLEQNLNEIRQEAIAELRTAIPHTEITILMQCFYFCVEHGYGNDTPLTSKQTSNLPNDEDYQSWQLLAHLLLTKQGTWRQSFSKKQGMPASSRATNADDKYLYQHMKSSLQNLIAHFQQNPKLLVLWQNIQFAPPPHYTDSQWQVLLALIECLPQAVAQLQLTFLDRNQLDFTEVAQRAVLALGDEEQPTSLALYLDYKIQHLLVDEFQDTSLMQFRFLQQLTYGWQAHDGRSLFLVGDPMQSIYRFRQAEVGLFLQVQNHGLGELNLTPLRLSNNFRADPTLVDWCNQHFSKVFPQHADIQLGAIPYHPATGMQASKATATVQFHPLAEADDDMMADYIVQIIQKTLTEHPQYHVGILVRTRNHAAPILAALKRQAMIYSALDMDTLAQHPLVQDLLTLTRALMHLGDRTAWLALLRAPWCGLTLTDMHTLVNDQPTTCVWELMQEPERFKKLSVTGQRQLQQIITPLQTALHNRERTVLCDWVQNTWLSLHGPACLSNLEELNIADTYWQCLQSCDQSSDDFSIDLLIQKLFKTYLPVTTTHDPNISVMTVHKAKGLEFDCVILPSLERKTANDTAPLLHWLERLNAQGEPKLLLAPIYHFNHKDDAIFHYLKQCHATKAEYEAIRLLYVAATRAKQQLHLCASIALDEAEQPLLPLKGSFLRLLWPQLASQCKTLTPRSNSSTQESSNTPTLKRLLLKSKPMPPASLETISAHSFQFQSQAQYTASTIGTVIHRLLHQLSLRGPIAISLPTWLDSQLITQELIQSGLASDQLDESRQIVKQALTKTVEDQRGRWILSPHQHAQSEWALHVRQQDQLKLVVLDRTFIADGVRWIIDFKTATPSSNDIAAFLQIQMKLHQDQLNQYANAVQTIDSNYPIKCALYFPLAQLWHSWDAVGTIYEC